MKKWKKVMLILLGIIAALVVVFIALVYIPSPTFEPVAYEPIAPDYWPTNGFLTTTPEEQGMDSSKLVEMVEAYQKAQEDNPSVDLDSITIIRNGYLVADITLDPLYTTDQQHVLHSAAKSVVPTLVGIAIQQGYIESVNVPVIEFFQDRDFEIADERIKDVTLKDLLTMRTGLRARDSYIYGHEGLWELFAADDLVDYFFSLPLDAEPGTRFDYSSLAYFMATAVIEQTTGMDPVAFARINLFDPLGIEEAAWPLNPNSLGLGFAPMWMKPHDFAKIGLLYLQKGQWDGQQIVPTEWVTESIIPHSYPKNYVDALDANGEKDNDASTIRWISYKFLNQIADGYGYMWYLDQEGYYAAYGTAGQYLMVAPEENLVVMVTSSASDNGPFYPATLFNKYILKAVQSDDPLAANVTAQNDLTAISTPPTFHQEPQIVEELPAVAFEISGNTYSLESNIWNNDNFQLIFDPALDYAMFSFSAKVDEVASIQVGLDGVYRISDTESGSYAAYGSWTSPNIFEIYYQQIGYSAPTQYALTFDQDTIEVAENSVIGSYTYSGEIE